MAPRLRRSSEFRRAVPPLLARVCLLVLSCAPGVAAAADNPVRTFQQGTPGAPFQSNAQSPLIQVSDGDDQVIELVPGFSVPVAASVWSADLDLGTGAGRSLLGISWSQLTGPDTSVTSAYSIDRRPWQECSGEAGFDLPEGTHGKTIAYRITLESTVAGLAPSVDDVTIAWRDWQGKPADSDDGNDTDQKPPQDSGTTHGSGTYTYPDTSNGGSAGTSAGTNAATGSGTGDGPGGPDSSGSASGGGVPTSGGAQDAAGSSAQPAGQKAPAPPPSQPVGPPTSVVGLPADSPAVTGMRLEAIGGVAAGADPAGAGRGDDGWHPPLVGTGVAVGALLLLFVPWLSMASDMRSISDPRRWSRSRAARLPGPTTR